MNTMHPTVIRKAMTVIACGLLLPALAHTQYEVDWYTYDGGGELHSQGIDFDVSGTIGQPDAGATMQGIRFSVEGGFWAGAPRCLGDLDGDLDVDLDDLTLLLQSFQGDGIASPGGDIDGDGDTDLDDLTLVLQAFGSICV
jgi:hypothetical protein